MTTYKLPIKLGLVCSGEPIRVDQLPPMSGEVSLHIHASEGWDKAHVKLEYNGTPYCLSLFVSSLEAFLDDREVKVRSYDLWPKEITYQARLEDRRLHPRSNGKVYREDAIIIDWGWYRLENTTIELYLERHHRRLRY